MFAKRRHASLLAGLAGSLLLAPAARSRAYAGPREMTSEQWRQELACSDPVLAAILSYDSEKAGAR